MEPHGEFEDVRVAIVDDNPIMQQILVDVERCTAKVKALHKYMGVRVTTEDVFTDGLSLLRALSKKRYDLVLLDLEMPIMDGLQATARIRHPEQDPSSASVFHSIRNSVSAPTRTSVTSHGGGSGGSLPRNLRPSTPSPTVRQMRYALTAVGSGNSSAASEDIFILEENRSVPIIAVTANAFLDQQRRHCLSVGFTEVVSKPVSPEAIRNIFERYLDPEARGEGDHVHLCLETLAELIEPQAGMRSREPSVMGGGAGGGEGAPRPGRSLPPMTQRPHATSVSEQENNALGDGVANMRLGVPRGSDEKTTPETRRRSEDYPLRPATAGSRSGGSPNRRLSDETTAKESPPRSPRRLSDDAPFSRGG
ncbi:hypothetical protein HK104_002967, partial [Borealophlyctis nickersoniae]